MKLNYSIKQAPVNIPIIFSIITLIAFLPFTSMLFALKNDAFTGYFPPKFFMSESIHSGYFPLWNPYINYGIPQYGDMSSGFWSPITWLIASTVGYNAYTFTLEEAIYIFLAGNGMYYLARYFNINKRIGILAGACYMCSGYIVGHLQHFNWISGAAFLPWCIRSYLEIHNNIRWSSVFKLGVTFLLLVTSAHPGIIIGSIYFFLLITIALFFKGVSNHQPFLSSLKKISLTSIIALCIVIIFCVGPIIGYSEILPYISRGEKLTLSTSLGEPTTIQSWVSLLLPLSTTQNDIFFSTDIAMRNCYFGLLLFWLLISAVISKKTNWQKFFFITLLFFSLLSLGGVIKKFTYTCLPLIGYVRLNGEFRIFTIFSAILIASIELNKQINKISINQKRIFYGISSILTGIIIYSLYHADRPNIFFSQSQYHAINRSDLKAFIDNITFNDTLLFQAVVQLFFLLWLYILRKNNALNLWLVIGIGEIMFAALLNIPFTGVGKASVKSIQETLNKSPAGIPIPPLQPTDKNDSMPLHIVKLVGDWSFYSKQIGNIKEVPYPIRFNSTINFFRRPDLQKINSQSFIYFSDLNPDDKISVLGYTPNCIETEISSSSNQLCTIKQNYYPNWHCYINNIPAKIEQTSLPFISIRLNQGTQKVLLKFETIKIIILLFWTIFIFILGIISVIIIQKKYFTYK